MVTENERPKLLYTLLRQWNSVFTNESWKLSDLRSTLVSAAVYRTLMIFSRGCDASWGKLHNEQNRRS